MKKHYPLVRTIHLYVGLFISPIVLIFSISALVLNHTDFINRTNPIKNLPDINTSIDKIPYDKLDYNFPNKPIYQLNYTE